MRIRVDGARNLRGVDVGFAKGGLTAVTGVSGSGKSTLVFECLAAGLRSALEGRGVSEAFGDSGWDVELEGWGDLDRLIVVDQSPIGANARSCPATHAGIFDAMRRVYARTRGARIRGFGASRFSFNHESGRCGRCRGLGELRFGGEFFPESAIRCPECGGSRYEPGTLEARFKGLSIGEALGLTVEEACGVFSEIPEVSRGLEALREAGLGYLTLGRAGNTLSGGEAQRVKLAAELVRREDVGGRTLYLLDEPTTGLHFEDTARLAGCLRGLTDRGNTVVVVEHNLDLIRLADAVIDLGPGAGDAGGRVVASGTPEEVARRGKGETARHLREALGMAGGISIGREGGGNRNRGARESDSEGSGS